MGDAGSARGGGEVGGDGVGRRAVEVVAGAVVGAGGGGIGVPGKTVAGRPTLTMPKPHALRCGQPTTLAGYVVPPALIRRSGVPASARGFVAVRWLGEPTLGGWR